MFAPPNPACPRQMADLEGTFSDFGLGAFWKLVVAIRSTLDEVEAHLRNGKVGLFMNKVELLNYDCAVVCVTRFHDDLIKAAGELIDQLGREMRSGKMKPGPVIFCELEFAAQPVAVGMLPRTGRSNVETILDLMTGRQGDQS